MLQEQHALALGVGTPKQLQAKELVEFLHLVHPFESDVALRTDLRSLRKRAYAYARSAETKDYMRNLQFLVPTSYSEHTVRAFLQQQTKNYLQNKAFNDRLLQDVLRDVQKTPLGACVRQTQKRENGRLKSILLSLGAAVLGSGLVYVATKKTNARQPLMSQTQAAKQKVDDQDVKQLLDFFARDHKFDDEEVKELNALAKKACQNDDATLFLRRYLIDSLYHGRPLSNFLSPPECVDLSGLAAYVEDLKATTTAMQGSKTLDELVTHLGNLKNYEQNGTASILDFWKTTIKFSSWSEFTRLVDAIVSTVLHLAPVDFMPGERKKQVDIVHYFAKLPIDNDKIRTFLEKISKGLTLTDFAGDLPYRLEFKNGAFRAKNLEDELQRTLHHLDSHEPTLDDLTLLNQLSVDAKHCDQVFRVLNKYYQINAASPRAPQVFNLLASKWQTACKALYAVPAADPWSSFQYQ